MITIDMPLEAAVGFLEMALDPDKWIEYNSNSQDNDKTQLPTVFEVALARVVLDLVEKNKL